MAEWYAVEVAGTTTDLMSNLNAVEQQGYEIFSVVISPRGWTVVARRGTKQEVPVAPEEKPRRGTVALKHKK